MIYIQHGFAYTEQRQGIVPAMNVKTVRPHGLKNVKDNSRQTDARGAMQR